MTNKEVIDILKKAKPDTAMFMDRETALLLIATDKAIEALEKMERYNKMAEHLAELGFICEHMPLDNPWCEKHCEEKEKPDIECVEKWLDWSEKERD